MEKRSMLVLSRQRLEAIEIGSGMVTVTVVEIERRKVRLCIEADGLTILRREVAPSPEPVTKKRTGKCVLTREIDQILDIEGGITITLLSIIGKNARIGIDAPSEIPIRRLGAVLA